jgi:putative transposase
MARPLRIEFAGALYHVTARGDRRACIYVDDYDRTLWLDILGMVCARFRFTVHAYCLMSNHFHLLVETPHGQLAAGMRQLNGVYSQAFNRRHRLVGHVFQGRYGAVLCEKEAYLKELARYIVLNPLRARMVASLDDWPWSSHGFVMGYHPSPPWFDSLYLLSHFEADLNAARANYLEYTLDGLSARRPLDEVQHQLFLGEIPEARNRKRNKSHLESSEISRANKTALLPSLSSYFPKGKDIKHGVIKANATGAFTLSEIARACGMSRRTVCRIIQAGEAEKSTTPR